MDSAALRQLYCMLLACAAVDVIGADGVVRAAPSRPGSAPVLATQMPSALATKKFGSVEYVSLADVATQLGLKASVSGWGRKLNLSGSSARAELEKDSRDIEINGLRVFLGEPVLEGGGQLYVSRVDFERCLAPQLRPGFGAPTMVAPKTIVLDPGHGGKDNGTSVNEKLFTLDVARRAKRLLEAAGHQVVLTRDSDVFLDLPQRSAIANAQHADVFVSIHFNADPSSTKTSGMEIFTFAPKGQHAAEWWSLRKKDDPHLETTDMPVNRFDHWNVVLAQAIHRRFVSDLKTSDRGKKLAHWGVLRSLDCPGVLVECGFLTSKDEAKKIATPAYRQKIAETLVAGIRDYAATLERTRPSRSVKTSANGPVAVTSS